MLQLWRRLPAIIRAILVGLLVFQIGGGISGALMLANLRLTPAVPWFLPATAIWLWLFWRYVGGWGWPASTSESRRADLRARRLPARVWWWAILAGGLAMIACMGLVFVTSRFGSLPERAYQAPFDVSAFPLWTRASIFLAIAATAGVVEEAAFRGYMLSMIQRRHGWWVGVSLVALLFYAAHLSHAYATIAFLPFFLVYSGVQGLLVFLTRSILPSVVLHAIVDAILVPMQFGVVPSPSHMAFVTTGGLSLLFAAVAVPAFFRLTAAAREESP